MEDKHLIYAVDDEESIRELYACALDSAGFTPRCFEDGGALFDGLEKETPSLIILDIMLDGLDGFGILQKLKADRKYAAIPVIMVSAKGEETNKVKGLNLGADDYMSKPFGIMEFIARVKANIRKQGRQNASECRFRDIEINDGAHEITICKKVIALTLKQYNLLKTLVENAERAICRDELLNTVWGIDYDTETRTLDMHIKELRRALEENGSGAEIVTVRGVGYILK